MLILESPRWSELQHAYGSAHDILALLGQLQTLPSSVDGSEPWFTLWSTLAHQGDVYSASFAAVPHVVHALACAPDKADHGYFQFPAWVEICRAKRQTEIPEDLRAAYVHSLAQLPSLVAAAPSRAWDPEFLACALAAVAAAKGQAGVAEAVLELTPDVAEEFMEWFFTR
ncbi:hypothetical protein GIY21_16320 [Xanthomonas sontii]|uniref:Uncharacterized protein n=1 Tax=Xanthomonas sontii TaxID=2650745 RepID=A0A6N7QBU5_9XANT|nr:hypothetical protein [Xanthomonas sontii]MRH01863.1 hypothetical protein [Xanthomonas sontii]MRH76082.1 hypothetical protein [Xanthomonas sontii]